MCLSFVEYKLNIQVYNLQDFLKIFYTGVDFVVYKSVYLLP